MLRALCALALSSALACVFAFSIAGEVRLAELPKEARETIALICAGGSFPYAKDGSVFGNREGALPKRERGYYREYSVETPASRDRGARRIVACCARFWGERQRPFFAVFLDPLAQLPLMALDGHKPAQ